MMRSWDLWKKNFLNAPRVLQVFFVFCMLVVAVKVSIVAVPWPEGLRFLRFGAPYLFCIPMLFYLILTRQPRYRIVTIAILLLAAAMEILIRAVEPNFLSDHRILFGYGTLVPIIWAKLMDSPRIRAFTIKRMDGLDDHVLY